MERSTTMGEKRPFGGNTNPLTDSTTNASIEGGAQTAHQTVDKVADKATVQVDRARGTAHRAVDAAADVATSTTDWASSIPEQARQVQTKFTEATSASIRARPIATVAGALVIGYLLGRVARL